jgi:porphobilinogen synthase
MTDFLPHTAFPHTRLRRNRQTDWSRRLVAENTLSVNDLIWPLFVIEGDALRQPIASLPGIERLTIDLLVEAAREARDVGIPAIAIFPSVDPSLKTADAREAINPDNIICRAVRAVKKALPDLGIICDVALDPFSADGHDGLVINGLVDNDRSLDVLAQMAVVQAQAGCDIVAPSDMMDGRIRVLRDTLDQSALNNVQILSYAAKYASAFYGPFRDAVGSGSALKGDKKTYQMDTANKNEALREVALDISEGSDMVMVKPGMPYLDIIAQIKDAFGVPTFAYQVSGEYAMLKAASQNGWLDWPRAITETLLSFKRAGADAILTYAALEVAKGLR